MPIDVLIGTEAGARSLSAGPEPRLPPVPVDHLIPADDGWFALTDRRTLWRIRSDGTAEIVTELPEVAGTCLLPVGDDVLVGTEGARIVRVDPSGAATFVTGFDAAPDRDAWYTPWGGPPAVRSMALTGHGSWLVNVHVGGILRSTDDGRTWTQTTAIDADVHQVIADGAHAYAASAWAIGVSDDDGRAWTYVEDGLHATYSRAVALTERSLFASVSTGPGGGRSAVYRGRRDGTGLERLRIGDGWFADNIDTHCLAAIGSTVVVAERQGVVHRSDDDGATWQVAARGLPSVRCVAIRVH